MFVSWGDSWGTSWSDSWGYGVVPPVQTGPSVPQKFQRWASYQKIPGSFIRQVSPGVYLRVTPENLDPQVVVNEQVIAPAATISTNILAKQILGDRAVRKIRKELRRVNELETRLAEQERLSRAVNAKLRATLDREISLREDDEDVVFLLLNS